MPVSALPITLGITGHRDVQDIALLLPLIEQEISAIADRYKNSPLLALSSLAEGADRLFARVAMQHNIPLHVVLPFSQQEYEKDFISEDNPSASVLEFRELHDYALRTGGSYCIDTVVPGSEAMISDTGNPRGSLYRDLQYAKAGMYMAERSHILFALWDGADARGLGGTAQVVSFRRQGRLQDRDMAALNQQLPGIKRYLGLSGLLDIPDTGLVCHIHVCRKNGRYAGEQQYPSVSWYPPLPASHGDTNKTTSGEDSWYDSLNKLDQLNAAIAEQEKHHPSAVGNHFALSAFSHVDRLASRQMSGIRQRYSRIFCLAALTALVGNRVPGDPESWVIISLFASLLLLLLLAVSLWSTHRSDSKAEATVMRALAEGLRVQNVWRKAGIFRPVTLHYLRRSHPRLAWVRRALLGSSVYPRPAPQQLASDLESIRQEWVAGQHHYLETNTEQKEQRFRRFRKMAGTLFGSGIGLTALVLLSSLTAISNESVAHELHLHAFNMWGEHLAEFLIASAALCAGYAKFLGFEEDITDYQRSAALFATAEQRMSETTKHYLPDQEDIRETLYALGCETLQENARWVARETSRDVELIGG